MSSDGGLWAIFWYRPTWEIVRDIADILIVAFIIYRALLVLRGTRAMQMGIGLGVVVLIYLGAKYLQFATLLQLFAALLSNIILIAVVVFQNDIRRALIRVGGRPFFVGARRQQSIIEEVVAAATELARHRTGALITFEQDANVLEFANSQGVTLDADVTRELLVTLFIPEAANKLHDGAVLIRNMKIARAGVFFPMPDIKVHEQGLGTRHRAAIGITEETDALVVVVSEEKGVMSYAYHGTLVSGLDADGLRQALEQVFGRRKPKRGRFSVVPPAKEPTSVRPAPKDAPAPAARPTLGIRTPLSPVRPLDERTRSEGRTESRSDPPPPPAIRPSVATPIPRAASFAAALMPDVFNSLQHAAPAPEAAGTEAERKALLSREGARSPSVLGRRGSTATDAAEPVDDDVAEARELASEARSSAGEREGAEPPRPKNEARELASEARSSAGEREGAEPPRPKNEARELASETRSSAGERVEPACPRNEDAGEPNLDRDAVKQPREAGLPSSEKPAKAVGTPLPRTPSAPEVHES